MGPQATTLREHADRMTEQYSTIAQSNQCACCGKQTGTFTRFEWCGVYHDSGTLLTTIVGLLMSLGGQGIVSHKRISFLTYHALCTGCLIKLRTKKVLAALVGHSNFALILISIGAFVISVAIICVLLANNPSMKEIATFLWINGFAIIGLTIGILMEIKLFRWVLPSALRGIAKRPFKLQSLSKQPSS